MAKRAAAGTLALAVCLSGGVALAGAASAATGFKFDQRVAGDDRYKTAVAASKAAFPGTSDSVVVVNGDRTVDGLTASYVAGLHGAPILYTNADGKSISTETHDEIARLKAKNVYIVGGSTVVSDSLEASWKSAGFTVIRLGGTDRFDTAAKVAKSGTTKPAKVIIASGERYADALVAGPVAYAKQYPILLTSNDGVPAPTSEALKDLGVAQRTVIGGTAVVSASTYSAVAGTKRLEGAGRQATATNVAEDAIANEGFSAASVALVGNLDKNAADALVAAPLAAMNKTPLLFIDAGYAGAPTATYLTSKYIDLTGKGYVFGGEAAVSAAAAAEATTAASTVTGASSLTVTAGDTVVESITGSRTYTVSGLKVGTPVRLSLVAPTSIDGTTFPTLDAAKRNASLTLATNARIDQINGVDVTAALEKDFTPTSTSLTFRVKGATAAEDVVPVVFANADDDDKIAVNLAGAAKEAAGIGGKVSFKAAAVAAPAEVADATAHVSTNLVATVVGTTGFTDGTAVGQFMLRDGDTYQLNGASITKAQFLSILSLGDTVANIASYKAGGSTANTFNITGDVVADAGDIVPTHQVSTTTLGQVKVTYNTDDKAALNSTVFELQRRQVSAATVAVAGTAGEWTTVNSRTVAATGVQTFTETLPSGKYEYRTRAISPAFSGTATVSSAPSAVAEVSTTTTLALPELQRVYLTSNATAINTLNKGDVVKVVLTQPINTPAAGATLTIGGETITHRAAAATATDGSATFTVNSSAEVVDGVSQAAGRVLTVTLLADPAGAVSFSTATLTASTGIGNSVGALVAPTGDNNVVTRDVVS